MISVDQALSEILNLFSPLETEWVAIEDANARILSQSVQSHRDQPPFDASAMDGYAVKSAELDHEAQLMVIGEAAAGKGFDGTIKPGQAVRIFTGAPVPDGADRILIQEDCTRHGKLISVGKNIDTKHYIRKAGSDFSANTRIDAPLALNPSVISLLAAMNIASLPVYRKPNIALIATGDELVHPSETPQKDQIVSSNNFGLKALVNSAGGHARLLPIARDNRESLLAVLDLCTDADAIVTLGGASVGDHDIMGQLIQDGTIESHFYKVAMRPGKPLMAGRYKGVPLIGLPGNPVSALVCGQIFLIPAIRAMLGFEKARLTRESIPLKGALPPNGPREHYMRAKLKMQDGQTVVEPFSKQDSALLSVMTKANCLLVRPPNDPALNTGQLVEVIRL